MLAAKSKPGKKKNLLGKVSTNGAQISQKINNGHKSKSPVRGFHHHNKPAVALSRAVQTKITVGKAGDQYEREADDIADKVSSGQSAGGISRIPSGGLKAQTKASESDNEQAQAFLVQREANENDSAQVLRQ